MEFKQILCEGVYKTICAFINTYGGTIFVGVNDNGDVVGYNPNNITIEAYNENTFLWKKKYIRDEMVNVGKRKVLVIKVLPGEKFNEKTCLASWKGNQYKRIGSSTKLFKKELLPKEDKNDKRILYEKY